MEYLVQIDGTWSFKWETIGATDKEAAALTLLRKTKDVQKILPCTIYVSIGDMRHDNGSPMAVQAYKVNRSA